MPAVSSIFLVVALILAVVIGPQTRPWTWGPAMLALAMSVAAALPLVWKRSRFTGDFGLLAFGALVVGWFAWRAWMSPVAELGQADLLLLAGVVGTFISIRGVEGDPIAERILIWGIALLLLANVIVIGMQVVDPTYSPIFRARATPSMVSGFFAHYNETANYLIASSMLVGAAALSGRHMNATRILWVIIAIAGLAGVWFTRSRGGILGAAVASGVFAGATLVIGKRRGARWFAPSLIAMPIVGLGIGIFLFMGWQEAQEARKAGGGIELIMDNTIRLYLMGIAISCISLHPMTGGGSRSYSWECYRFWEKNIQGAGGARPELVHHELLQAATDYGIIGAGLLVGLLVTLVLVAVIRILFPEPASPSDGGSSDAWRLGGLAGLAGMFVQSCFSFVFHLLPGIVLLGICLGQMSRSMGRPDKPQIFGSRILLTLTTVFCLVLLIPAGWKGLHTTRILWASYFSKEAFTSTESKIDALTEAIQIWPQASLYQDRAALFHEAASSSEGIGFHEPAERAIEDYHEASWLYPFDPGLAINRANLLSQMRRDSEAEEDYAKAISLQGGMEAGFRSHFFFALHLYYKGLRQFHPDQPEAALNTLETAAGHMEEAVKQTPAWVIYIDGRDARISIHESLGTVREAAGDREGALQAYDFACTIPTGNRAHYRAGVLIGKAAVEAWSKRKPSEALTRFMEARQRVLSAGDNLPQGVTPSQRVEYLAYLDRTIAFLKGAKVEPVKPAPPRR